METRPASAVCGIDSAVGHVGCGAARPGGTTRSSQCLSTPGTRSNLQSGMDITMDDRPCPVGWAAEGTGGHSQRLATHRWRALHPPDRPPSEDDL